MSFIADGLLLAGALTAAFYCWILSVRVKGLKDLDTGLGSAIAALSNQVNEMQKALKSTQAVTGASISEMENLADRAEAASNQLRMMLAAVEEKRSSKIKESEKPPVKSNRVKVDQDLDKKSSNSETSSDATTVSDVNAVSDAKTTSQKGDEITPDDKPATSTTGRVKKFPTKAKMSDNTDDKGTEDTEIKGKIGQWRARKLQKEVADRIKERDDPAEREDLVQVLQEILAANK